MVANINDFTDFSEISDAWRDAASSEKKALEDAYRESRDRDTALRIIAEARVNEFGKTPLTTVEFSTDRDIYNVLKSVYDRSGGNWDMVGKVIKYNKLPKELINKFIKDGEWTDYSVGDEVGSGFVGAMARGASGATYGGILNDLTGGKYAEKYVDEVPEGLDYEDSAKSHFRAGVRQARAYGRSLAETDPGMELAGNLVGSIAPINAASKATAGMNVLKQGTTLAKAGNVLARGAATGALYSVPESMGAETLSDALKNTRNDAIGFAVADALLGGAGKTLGWANKGLGRIANAVAAPKENITKAYESLKPLTEMSANDIKRIGTKEGWFKDGQINITDYLAKQHGMKSTRTIEELAKTARGNREVYNKLKDETKFFDYKDALKKAAQDAVIPDAPLSRFNQLIKSLPEKLEKFTDDIIGFSEEEGVRLSDKMSAFNDFVKHELRSIKNPNRLEKQAIDNYLKDVEAANMKQFMKAKLPSELDAVDKSKTLLGEVLKNLSIVGIGPLIKSPIRTIQDKVERNYIRQLIAGEKYREKMPITRMLQKIGRGEKAQVNTDKLRMPARVTAAEITRNAQKD